MWSLHVVPIWGLPVAELCALALVARGFQRGTRARPLWVLGGLTVAVGAAYVWVRGLSGS